MKKYEKFLKNFFIFLFIYLLFHSITWLMFTSKIFGQPNGIYGGDLTRITYSFDILNPRQLKYTLSNKHLSKETYKYQNIDVITIGDSFSNGIANGLNPYYQDYLATKYNLNVLNILMDDKLNFLNTVIGLYNNGTLKKISPHFIIIETIQREIIHLNLDNINFNYHLQHTNINDIVAPRLKQNPIPNLSIINNINYKVPFYFFYSLIKKHKIHNGYKFYLKKNLFFNNKSNKLVVYKNDINNIPQFSKKNIKKLNNKLNRLANILQKLNITLIFMPAVDKYDLYYPYIKNKAYPKSQFFETLRPQKKQYIFIDTKKILSRSLQNNISDIFYQDDTHWSYKASDIVTDAKEFKDIFQGYPNAL